MDALAESRDALARRGQDAAAVEALVAQLAASTDPAAWPPLFDALKAAADRLDWPTDCDHAALALQSAAAGSASPALRTRMLATALERAGWCAACATSGGEGTARMSHVRELEALVKADTAAHAETQPPASRMASERLPAATAPAREPVPAPGAAMTPTGLSNDPLLRAFGIDASDLAANRAGRLAPAQAARLRRSGNANLLGALPIGALLGAILFGVAARPLAPVQWILSAALFAAVLATGLVYFTRTRADAARGIVACHAGQVRVGMRGRAGWYLSVGEASFRLPVRRWLVTDGAGYRVYVAPEAQVVVGMEAQIVIEAIATTDT